MKLRELREKLEAYDENEDVSVNGEEFDVKFSNHQGKDRIRLETGIDSEYVAEVRDELKQLTEAIQKVAELGVNLRVKMANEELPMPKEFMFVKELLSAIK